MIKRVSLFIIGSASLSLLFALQPGTVRPLEAEIGKWAKAWVVSHKCSQKGIVWFKTGAEATVSKIDGKQDIFIEIDPDIIREHADFDPHFGIPVINSDLVVPGMTSATRAGMIRALEWYAQNGIYPQNSVINQLIKQLPNDISWTNCQVGQASVDQHGNSLAIDAKTNKMTFCEAGSNIGHQFNRIKINHRSDGTKTASKNLWYFDKAKSSVVFYNSNINRFYQIDFSIGKILNIGKGYNKPHGIK